MPGNALVGICPPGEGVGGGLRVRKSFLDKLLVTSPKYSSDVIADIAVVALEEIAGRLSLAHISGATTSAEIIDGYLGWSIIFSLCVLTFIMISGRLGGAEIARTEQTSEGSIPLSTMRADVDYGFAEAKTTYGIIGVKTWIYRGDILEHDPSAHERRATDFHAGGPVGSRAG